MGIGSEVVRVHLGLKKKGFLEGKLCLEGEEVKREKRSLGK